MAQDQNLYTQAGIRAHVDFVEAWHSRDPPAFHGCNTHATVARSGVTRNRDADEKYGRENECRTNIHRQDRVAPATINASRGGRQVGYVDLYSMQTPLIPEGALASSARGLHRIRPMRVLRRENARTTSRRAFRLSVK